MKRTGTELKNKMSRQERREARLRQEKLRLQKKSKLTLIVYAVIRLIVVGVLVRSAFNGQIESVYTCLLTLVLLLGVFAGITPSASAAAADATLSVDLDPERSPAFM